MRGGRRFGPGPDGRLPGRPEGSSVFVVVPPNRIGTPVPVPTPPGAPAGSLAASAAPPVPPPTGPGGPFDDASRRVRFGPPPEGRGPGGEPRPEDPADPNRIRIDMRQIRQDLFRELVADRDAFDALPLEDKQKVFASIEQRMAGVAQGITVLQKELSSRAGDARTREAAVAAAAQLAAVAKATGAVAAVRRQLGAPVAPSGHSDSASASAPTTAAPMPPPAVPPAAAAPAPPAPPSARSTPRAARPPVAAPAPPRPPQMKRSTELSGQRLAVKVERDGQIVGQVNADVDLTEAAGDDLRSHGARARRAAVRGRRRRRALHIDAVRQAAARRRCRHRRSAPAAQPGTTVLPDWIVATTPDPTGSGLKFGIARPVGDALVDLRATSARNAALGLGFIGLALDRHRAAVGRADPQSRLAQRRRPPHRRRRLQRPRAGALEGRDRAARRRVQQDGGRRRGAPAGRGVAGAHPSRARAGPADPARHAAAGAAACSA